MIDIHTHNFSNKEAVVNLTPSEFHKAKEYPDHCFSIGIHPLSLQDAEDMLSRMKGMMSGANILFVGETGIDKRADNIAEQTRIFERQMQIASDAKKPVVIHNVRATNEILHIARNTPDVPLIFHGFRGKPLLAEQILNAGHYLSFGEKSLLAPETIRITPLEHLFIETDESTMPLADIYIKVAEIKGENIETIDRQTKTNLKEMLNRYPPTPIGRIAQPSMSHICNKTSLLKQG